jgi:hypothetical protein
MAATVKGNMLAGGKIPGIAGLPSVTPFSGFYLATNDLMWETSVGAVYINASCNKITGFVNGVIVFDEANGQTGGLPPNAVVAFRDNDIYGNSTSGMTNGFRTTDAYIDARLNWWGSSSGPDNPGTNPVLGNVVFSPFYFSPSSCAAPQTMKSDAKADLTNLRNSTSDKEDKKKLSDAIEQLTKALDPSLWVDGSHLDQRKGEKVFQAEKDAVNKLRELLDDKKSTVSHSALLDLIQRLVNADQKLAAIAISDASTGDPKDIEKAMEELTKGGERAAQGKYDDAIEHYKNAWKSANKAV